MGSKQGVLLLNLGSPDSTSVPDVRKYLREFLMDGRVLDAPYPIRKAVVEGLILPRRPRQSAEAYASIWWEEGAPLLVISERVRGKLAAQLEVPVELGMRYGNPSTPAAVRKLREQGVTEILIMPQYPHYAMSSYETAVVWAQESIREHAPDMSWTLLQPYYNDPGYIEALYRSAEQSLQDSFDLLLFSFHGIPERHLRKTDPSHAHCLTTGDCCNVCHPSHHTCYRHQCLETVKAFAGRAGLAPEKVRVSFQSRLGRDPWLTPYTDKTLEKLPGEGVKRLKVMCAAFTADCLETLEEISEEGKEIFESAGGEAFEQIPCMNDHPAWIDLQRLWVEDWLRTGKAQPSRASAPGGGADGGTPRSAADAAAGAAHA
jgi:ferrochelatase